MVNKSVLVCLALGSLFLFGLCHGYEGNHTELIPTTSISTTVFEDDFSTDKGWTSSPPDKIYRDVIENNVHYYTDRGHVQVMYHPLSPLTEDFTLDVDTMLSGVNGNGFVYIGLTDDINEVNWYWKGLGIVVGKYASYYFAQVAAKYSDGSMYFSLNDDPAKDKHIDISTNKWYTFEFSKTGQTWRLDAYDENKVLVKSINGEFTGTFAVPFNYVLFGNGDTSQWETAEGKIDNLKLKASKTSIAVAVDIKPGSCPNPINLKSKGVIPVAILGTKDFDVTTIDPKTVSLTRDEIIDNVSPTRWNYDDIASPFNGELCDCHELDGDGYIDMMLQFDTQTLVTKLRLGTLRGWTLPLKLTGYLKKENGGTLIRGQDCIKVLDQGKVWQR